MSSQLGSLRMAETRRDIERYIIDRRMELGKRSEQAAG